MWICCSGVARHHGGNSRHRQALGWFRCHGGCGDASWHLFEPHDDALDKKSSHSQKAGDGRGLVSMVDGPAPTPRVFLPWFTVVVAQGMLIKWLMRLLRGSGPPMSCMRESSDDNAPSSDSSSCCLSDFWDLRPGSGKLWLLPNGLDDDLA
jgi:hypothetical protein